DLVALGDLVEDLGAEAVERGAQAVELLADAGRAGRDPRRAAVVEDVGVDDLLERGLVGRGLVLVDEAPDDVSGLHAGLLLVVGPAGVEEPRAGRPCGHRQTYQSSRASRSCSIANSAAAARLETPIRA